VELYDKWDKLVNIADINCVNIVSKFDFSWVYLICGLALSVAAIVIPAHQELGNLHAKLAELAEDYADVQHRVPIYDAFLRDVNTNNPDVYQRIVDLQFNRPGSGEIVVIDNAAVQTPLEWLSDKARRRRIVPLEKKQASVLSSITNGRGRLVLLGVGAFTMFIGFVKNPIMHDPTIPSS
tara:strand:- start:213 stop:752 length:540 start_codon:yes stop_codon:yes gene_type:complete